MARLLVSIRRSEPRLTIPRSGNYLVDMYDDALDAEEKNEMECYYEVYEREDIK